MGCRYLRQSSGGIQTCHRRRIFLAFSARMIVWMCLPLCLLQLGCGEQPDPPNDTKYWGTLFTATPGNGLVEPNDGTGSATSNWVSVFKERTKNSVTFSSKVDLLAGAEVGLNLNNTTSIRSFLSVFVSRESITPGNCDPLNFSFLFGIQAPSNSGTVLGWTVLRTDIGNDMPWAASFVYKKKIYDITDLTTPQERWRAVENGVLHEVGHARGLSADGGREFDHQHHGGSYDQICVMYRYARDIAIGSHHFCGMHQKILRECLSQFGTYSSSYSNTCWQQPYE